MIPSETKQMSNKESGQSVSLSHLTVIGKVTNTHGFDIVTDGEPEVVTLIQFQNPLNLFSRFQLQAIPIVISFQVVRRFDPNQFAIERKCLTKIAKLLSQTREIVLQQLLFAADDRSSTAKCIAKEYKTEKGETRTRETLDRTPNLQRRVHREQGKRGLTSWTGCFPNNYRHAMLIKQ